MLLFSFYGRINRSRFWLGQLLVWSIVIGGVQVSTYYPAYKEGIINITVLIWTVGILAIITSRLRDIGASPWLVVLIFPLFIAILPIIILGSLPSKEEDRPQAAYPPGAKGEPKKEPLHSSFHSPEKIGIAGALRWPAVGLVLSFLFLVLQFRPADLFDSAKVVWDIETLAYINSLASFNGQKLKAAIFLTSVIDLLHAAALAGTLFTAFFFFRRSRHTKAFMTMWLIGGVLLHTYPHSSGAIACNMSANKELGHDANDAGRSVA